MLQYAMHVNRLYLSPQEGGRKKSKNTYNSPKKRVKTPPQHAKTGGGVIEEIKPLITP